ncbi:MAG: amino acid adenylation domain-containing protein [Clostridiales bacterium]|nr:amino acid adenylation domain-containing protein [Clostridiales bacterium]
MIQETYELTNPQKNIYLTEQFYTNTNINNICGISLINHELDFNILVQSINMVIKNNLNFQTQFFQENNIPKQFFNNYEYVDIEIHDIPSEEHVYELAAKMKKKCFNIFSKKLYEFKIFRFPNNKGGYILNIHHLIADSWSLGLVSKQIIKYYNLINLNKEPVLGTENNTYKDYIIAEQEYLNSKKFEEDKKYWESIFNTIPENALIPSKNSHSTSKLNCTAIRKTFSIPNNITKKINYFCEQNKLSIYNLFMAIYSIYIGKICNLTDFVIGTPILNRCNFAQKNTHGMFITTLPVRINLSSNNTFLNYIKNFSLNSISMFRHQKYPYEKILEMLRKKQPDIPNLYNILFSYQITKTSSDELNSETKWEFNNNCPDSLQIHVLDLNDIGDLNIFYDYQTQFYDSDDIEKLHKRIINIINQILDNPNININDINIVTPEEKQYIFNTLNNTDTPYDNNQTIIDLFKKQVQFNPSKNAIICNNKQITYDELNKKSNQLAYFLLENNFTGKDLIGIMTSRSIEMVIGLLAILKIGATYVPLDSTYPEDRVLYIAENSNTKALLVDDTTYNNIENILKINISLNSNIYNNYSTEDLNININAEDLMYVIYTSGSTGKPKGVLLTHKNFTNFLTGIHNTIPLSPTDNILSITTICFDIFTLELWGGLANGLTVVVATENEQNNSELLNELCEKNNITVMQTTPSRILSIIKQKKHINFINNLKILMLGGEALQKNIVDKILQYPNIQLFNMYGPTETTVWSTIKQITNNTDISIGKPLANTQCYILNNDLKLLPPYTPGILYIGGDGVSKGYYNLPKLTLEKFIYSPYDTNKIIYNTGDLAYYDTHGEIFHLGRNDFQVKIRGYRIELEEIENQILSYPNILETAVISDTTYLICYYTSSSKINESDLINYLLKNLPDYMIPSDFIKLDKMPLTPNGKLNRKLLPKLVKSELIEEPPITENEKILANVLSTILHKEITNINASFMVLGLDSLGIIQAQSALLSYNINLTTHHFYKYSTIKKLAENININESNDFKKTFDIPDKFKHYPDELLAKISSFNLDENILGNVFLTGSNGFIGIHILNEILTTTSNKIFCLVRGENTEIRYNKLINSYKYYFNEDLTPLLNNRVFIIGGDMTYKNLNMSEEDLKILQTEITTIINTAATVKHYGNIQDFEKNNILGTKNIAELAFTNNIRLIHLSSISVSGNYLVKQNNRNTDFSENDLYIGQQYEENNYVYSKLESEKVILDYMSKGLTAQIQRIGIVSGRLSDGFFQKNIQENAFYNRIKSIINMAAISNEMSLQKIEFTPVDLCAKAIVKLAKNSIANNKIFNVYNHHLINIYKLIDTLKDFNININILNSQDFNDHILDLSRKNNSSISGIINDFNYNENNLLTINYNYTVNIHSKYTRNYLHLLNFDWPSLDTNYLTKILTHMKNVDFI